jgi:hypothetical protein
VAPPVETDGASTPASLTVVWPPLPATPELPATPVLPPLPVLPPVPSAPDVAQPVAAITDSVKDKAMLVNE